MSAKTCKVEASLCAGDLTGWEKLLRPQNVGLALSETDNSESKCRLPSRPNRQWAQNAQSRIRKSIKTKCKPKTVCL